MPVNAKLITEDGVGLHTEKIGRHTHLITEDHSRVATQFQAAGTASAATTIIVQPRAGAALVITDLTISQTKVASGTLTIQFADGTRTVTLYKGSSVNVPLTLHVPYAGRIRGWKDARVEMVSAGTNPVTEVTVAYYHLRGKGAFAFAAWDAQR